MTQDRPEQKRGFIQSFLKRCETSQGKFPRDCLEEFLVQTLAFYSVKQGLKWGFSVLHLRKGKCSFVGPSQVGGLY